MTTIATITPTITIRIRNPVLLSVFLRNERRSDRQNKNQIELEMSTSFMCVKGIKKVKLFLWLNKHHAIRRMGEWRYSSIIIYIDTRWRPAVSRTTRSLLPPRKESSVPIIQKAEWTAAPVCTVWRREKSLVLRANWTPVVCPVAYLSFDWDIPALVYVCGFRKRGTFLPKVESFLHEKIGLLMSLCLTGLLQLRKLQYFNSSIYVKYLQAATASVV
jgi:hypothetical protein